MRPLLTGTLIALLAPLALTGCATLQKLGLDVGASSNRTYNSNDMNDARKKGDTKLLSAMCMQTVKAKVSVHEACNHAMDLFIEQNDHATLAEICTLKNPGEKYEKWFTRTKACNHTQNHKGSQDIQVLLDADCATLESAFDDAAGALGGLKSQREANDAFKAVAKKAVECKKITWMIERVNHWGSTSKEMGYASIEAAAQAGVEWEETFFKYVAAQGQGELLGGREGQYFLTHYLTYLIDNGMTKRCEDYIPVAERVEDSSFGPINWYFRETNCKAAADVIAKRMTSPNHRTRRFACKSLGHLGAKKHKRQITRLANNDPYFWLKEKDEKGNLYLQPIKVYDVRDECAAAANRL